MKFLQTIIEYKSKLIQALFEHLEISVLSVLIAIIIGVPLGIYIAKNRKIAKYVLGFANIFQTVPSLALFGLIIPILGIGIKPSIFVLFLYALLPIIMNTYIGLNEVEDFLIDSAIGIGMNSKQILYKIKLPLATPVIMGGIKIATVASIGTATIAALIGAGGFGSFIFRGISTNNHELILLGAIPTALLAIGINYVLGVAETALTPKKSSIKTNLIKKYKKIILSSIALIFIIPFFAIISMKYREYQKRSITITIGNKNYTEQRILSEIYRQLIKKETNYSVKTVEIAGSQLVFEALKTGEIDFYPEYTGTAYVLLFKQKKVYNSNKIYEYDRENFKKQFGLTYLKRLGFNNKYLLFTRADLMKKYNLKTISDLKKYNGKFVFGGDNDFIQRPDGLIGVSKKYGLIFKSVKAMDLGLLFIAIKNRKLDIIMGSGTDGRVQKYNLKELKDDKHFFLPYNIAPLLGKKIVDNHPEIIKILNKLSNKLSTKRMQKLNYMVDQEGYTPKQAAKQFLDKYIFKNKK